MIKHFNSINLIAENTIDAIENKTFYKLLSFSSNKVESANKSFN